MLQSCFDCRGSAQSHERRWVLRRGDCAPSHLNEGNVSLPSSPKKSEPEITTVEVSGKFGSLMSYSMS